MLYEFTVTPGIFEEGLLATSDHMARDLIRLLDGLQQNGLIGNLCDSHLRREIGARISALPAGRLREDLRCGLEMLDKRQRFIDRPYVGPGWPGDDPAWLQEAVNSHSTENFYSIVTTELTANGRLCPPCTLRIGSVCSSALWTGRQNSRRVERSAAVFQDVLRPVLLNAKSLMLIDPHIQPERARYSTSLKAMVQSAYTRHNPGTLKIFEIHSKTDADHSWFFNELRSRIGPLVPSGCRIRLVLWEDPEDRFHNRFILTNFCGISVDRGLDESDQGPDQDDWEIIDERHREDVWNRFKTPGTPLYGPVAYDRLMP
jgi:hypothetical protein